RATLRSLHELLGRNRCECDCRRRPGGSRRQRHTYRLVLRRASALHALRAMPCASNARDLPLARFAKLKTFASNNGFQTIGAAQIAVKQRIFLLEAPLEAASDSLKIVKERLITEPRAAAA